MQKELIYIASKDDKGKHLNLSYFQNNIAKDLNHFQQIFGKRGKIDLKSIEGSVRNFVSVR